MSDCIIETRQLKKRFRKKTAVDGLDIQIPSGSVVGFVGVNGAGKTTTIRMLMGHLHPTDGEVQVLGEDPRRHSEQQRQRVAYVSENMNLPGWLTPEAAAKLNASFYPRWDAKLAQTLLNEFKLRKAGAYRNLSRGQKRKVCILPAICQNAELLVMDEPALGLDVMARHDFLKRVLEIVCSGERTVFISSHLLSDLERIVDRIVLIDRGWLVLQGNLEDLKAGVRQLHFAAQISREDLEQHFKVIRYEVCDPAETKAVVADFDEGRLRRMCELKDCTEKVRVFGLNLEDIFVELVKNGEGES
ncbi:MAG: ABC transporter ATP-binding protein [Planctomycetota bacterium]|jgi:ABC-2 type transport system ATP-binding protein